MGKLFILFTNMSFCYVLKRNSNGILHGIHFDGWHTHTHTQSHAYTDRSSVEALQISEAFVLLAPRTGHPWFTILCEPLFPPGSRSLGTAGVWITIVSPCPAWSPALTLYYQCTPCTHLVISSPTTNLAYVSRWYKKTAIVGSDLPTPGHLTSSHYAQDAAVILSSFQSHCSRQSSVYN